MLVLVPLWLIALTTSLALALGIVTGWAIVEYRKLGQETCNCCPVHNPEPVYWTDRREA